MTDKASPKGYSPQTKSAVRKLIRAVDQMIESAKQADRARTQLMDPTENRRRED